MGSLLEGDIASGTYPTPLAGTVRKMLLSSLARPLQLVFRKFGWPYLGHPKGPRITTTLLNTLLPQPCWHSIASLPGNGRVSPACSTGLPDLRFPSAQSLHEWALPNTTPQGGS